jgi:hypothetical protein
MFQCHCNEILNFLCVSEYFLREIEEWEKPLFYD